MDSPPPRILVVDDEEAILETMTFTFQDDYEVHTSTDARRGLEILDEYAPFAAVLTDQRMPDMSGVEFVSEVFKRHPNTVRMILTGFSDMEAIIQAINDGHVYSYITKPWEPDQLKQLMKQAVEHHKLSVENLRLVGDLRSSNRFLEAVMDKLDTGAIALDKAGLIQAVNRPVRSFFPKEEDPRGRPLEGCLESYGLEALGVAALDVQRDDEVTYKDIELKGHRFRVTSDELVDDVGDHFGRVILFREVSHEPLRRRFDDLMGDILEGGDAFRSSLEGVSSQLEELTKAVSASRIESAGMSELAQHISRTRTAIDNWLEVDSAMAREDFPDAQLLQDRMRIAMLRWPRPDELPGRVQELARRVEDYYESGEKTKQPVL